MSLKESVFRRARLRRTGMLPAQPVVYLLLNVVGSEAVTRWRPLISAKSPSDSFTHFCFMFSLNCFQFCSIEDQSMLSSSPFWNEA